MLKILLLTIVVFVVVMLIMALGFIISGRCLRGSCGGPSVLSKDGEKLSCSVCGREQKLEEENQKEP
jgi:hypothetical protein